jgi:hypothetical protein
VQLTARCALAVATAALLAASGCTPAKTGKPGGDAAAPPPTAASGRQMAIPVGPGPKSTYTAQVQPAAGTCRYRYTAAKQPLPDPACTPGATSPVVTQATIAQTICKAGGYTSTIRPPVNITNKEKTGNASSYGYTGPMGDAEYDHLLSGVVTVNEPICTVDNVGGMTPTVTV